MRIRSDLLRHFLRHGTYSNSISLSEAARICQEETSDLALNVRKVITFEGRNDLVEGIPVYNYFDCINCGSLRKTPESFPPSPNDNKDVEIKKTIAANYSVDEASFAKIIALLKESYMSDQSQVGS